MADNVLDVLANRAQWAVVEGDALAKLSELPAGCVHVCVTSPGYYQLRRYLPEGHPDRHLEHGSEATVDEYIARLVTVFDEVKRVLRDDGILACNIGDSYSGGGTRPGSNGDFNERSGNSPGLRKQEIGPGSNGRTCTEVPGIPPGNLLGVPWRLALALQERGWVWRSTICWRKLSPMPQSLRGWFWSRCRVKVKAVGNEADGWERTRRTYDPAVGGQRYVGVEWRDCPGCKRCEVTDGLVLRKGSWRPTPSHEPVFLFAKSMSYFADGEPVKQANAASVIERAEAGYLTGGSPRDASRKDAERIAAMPFVAAGANLRDYWADLDDEPDPDNMPDVLELASESLHEPHYAAFPTRLVSRILRFAASERGVCRVCAAPWARMVEHTGRKTCSPDLYGRPRVIELHGNGETTQQQGGAPAGCFTTESVTTGWRPTCTCPDPAPVGSIVLDPFCGSGSTGVAARRLGLRFVGIDLSPEYAAMSRRRIGRALREGKRQKPAKNEAPGLFDQEGMP